MRHPTGSSSGAILRSGDISFEKDRETGDLLTVVQPYCSEKCAAELKTNWHIFKTRSKSLSSLATMACCLLALLRSSAIKMQRVGKAVMNEKGIHSMFKLMTTVGMSWIILVGVSRCVYVLKGSASYSKKKKLHVHLISMQSKRSPNVGLEPTTTRLRVLRSANWANRAVRRTFVLYYIICPVKAHMHTGTSRRWQWGLHSA